MRSTEIILLLLTATTLISANEDRPVPIGFIGVRGKKSSELAYPGHSSNTNINTNQITSSVDKRGRFGFIGVRGKKFASEALSYPFESLFRQSPAESNSFGTNNALSEQKRRVPTGFIGVRGKKSNPNNNIYRENSLADNDYYFDRDNSDYSVFFRVLGDNNDDNYSNTANGDDYMRK